MVALSEYSNLNSKNDEGVRVIKEAQEMEYDEVISVLRPICPIVIPNYSEGKEWLQAFASNLKRELEKRDAEKKQIEEQVAEMQKSDSQLAKNEYLQALVDKYKTIIDDTDGVLSRLQQKLSREEMRWEQQLANKQRELDDLRLLVKQVLHVNMTESSKKRKKTSNEKVEKPNQTVVNRNAIDANWQKLLSSTLLMDKKNEVPAQEAKPDHYTGAFRRARKKNKKNQQVSNSVQDNLKTLNLNTEITSLTSNNPLVARKDEKTPNGHLRSGQNNSNKSPQNKLTKFIAIDCEMVGIGYDGNDHMLARVSLVNKFGDCIYDKFVKPREEVIDYRTSISGVRKEDLVNGEDFTTVQKEVSEIIRGRVLVGHSLKNDLGVLFLSHPKRNIRDTSKYKPFRKITKGSTPSLKRLAKEVLGIDIQGAEHSSVEDARAAMQLYCTVAKKWEAMMSEKRGGRRIEESG